MLVFKRGRAVDDLTDMTESSYDFFGPRMNAQMRAIADVRQALISSGYTGRYNGRTHRRELARIPPQLFVGLALRCPELFSNPQLLRTYLKNNPALLVVDKETL